MRCAIVQDLLPLYMDGVCSKETRELVEEHLNSCEVCRKIKADSILIEQSMLSKDDIKPFRKIRNIIFRLTVLCAILIIYITVWIFLINPTDEVRIVQGRYLTGSIEYESDSLIISQKEFLEQIQKIYPEKDIYIKHLNNVTGSVDGKIRDDDPGCNLVLTESHFGICEVFDCHFNMKTGKYYIYKDYTWKWEKDNYETLEKYKEFLNGLNLEKTEISEGAEYLAFVSCFINENEKKIELVYYKNNEIIYEGEEEQ